MCWYSQSAAYTSLSFGTTQSGWWMNGKAFTILNTSCLSEFSRITAARTPKIPYLWQTMRFKLSKKGKKTNILKKPESCAFSGFMVSISHVWEWKSTTGRFATSRFWPFTWKTSSVGDDKVYKWKFCKLKITDYCCFCNHDSTHFSILRVSTNALYDCYSRIFDSFIVIH